jgi:primosomal protein N' (replication factor Y)
MYCIEVLLPLFLKTLIYAVPPKMKDSIRTGVRVIVPLKRRKMYSGIVVGICEDAEKPNFEIKEILGAIDETPIVTASQMELWKWIADYYMCTLGEVMKAALPAYLKLESRTKIAVNRPVCSDLPTKFMLDSIDRKIIANLLEKPLYMEDLTWKVSKTSILPNVRKLLDLGIIDIEEELINDYKSKHKPFVFLHPNIDSEEKLNDMLDSLSGPKQKQMLLKYIELTNPQDFAHPPEISKSELLDKSGLSDSVYKTCEEKGIFVSVKKKIDRLQNTAVAWKDLPELSQTQQKAFEELKAATRPVLLHGITSSGKTEIYIKLIDETLKDGKQVLYLLPEIALTTQIIERLRTVFGSRIGVYHSNFSDAERTEVYNNLLKFNPQDPSHLGEGILGVRSSLLLPFENLGLIIVDEEHETTYKQYDPAPRYNARDAALVLGKIHGAKVVLGSATPSLESYYNASKGKYDLIKLTERYGNAALPEIRTIDMIRARRKKTVVSGFSEPLLSAIKNALERKEQVILFQNRRGFSPFVQCDDCGHVAKCKHCDVSLTYHKHDNALTCHYCGYSISMPPQCPACNSTNIKTKGMGTEKIEDELSLLIPEAKIERLDLDSTKSKYAYGKILSDFEAHAIDILVGTQMITKGLDFGNVSLVGIMNADSLLNFPDFRAYERSFQLMSQVAGRAGRKDKRGEVIIQTTIPENHVIRQVIKYDYDSFFSTQTDERRMFNYPPFCRLILLSIKHPKQDVLREAGNVLKITLTEIFGKNVAGPEPPPVGRVQNKYILNFRIKLRKNSSIDHYKHLINAAFTQLKSEKKYAGIITVADVDPM